MLRVLLVSRATKPGDALPNFRVYILGRDVPEPLARHETVEAAIADARARHGTTRHVYAVRWERVPGAIFSIALAGELHGRGPDAFVPHGTPYDGAHAHTVPDGWKGRAR